MYPILFSIPAFGISVSSFGAMMSLGFLAAYFLTRRAMPRYQIDPRFAPLILVLCVAGGILGAKAYYATDMVFREGHSWAGYFLRSGGLTWYGGLGGAIALAWLGSLAYQIPFSRLLDSAAVAVPVGQAFGRMGCFLVGDDYGRPSQIPWALSFPKGMPPTTETVHPTQLYEFGWLLIAAAVLTGRRATSPRIFAEYLIANGLGRLVIEHFRVNPRIALNLSEPQWIAIGMVVGGTLWLAQSRRAAHSVTTAS